MSFITSFLDLFKRRTTYIAGSGVRSSARIPEISESELCQAIIDCNATHISRGRVMHVKTDPDGRVVSMLHNSEYTKLFNRPNPMMTRQDFLYAMAWNLQITNTAFAWIKWDAAMHPVEIWPLIYLQFEIRETLSGGYAAQITDTDGQQYTVSLEDLIVIRRKYNGNGYAGSDNSTLNSTLEMVESLDEGLQQAVNISNKIHGFVRQKNAMLAPTDTKGTQDEFIKRMNAAAKDGGVVALDATEEYTPINVSTWSASAAQQKQIYDRVYTYWRTPQEVVLNTASEQVMQNYFDSVVETVWEEFSEAFTSAVFTRREQDFGNKIIVYSGALTGASWQTKLNVITYTKETGLLSVNEYREILGYAPVEDGDERLVSLNYIKSTDMSKYQTGNEDDPTETEDQNES